MTFQMQWHLWHLLLSDSHTDLFPLMSGVEMDCRFSLEFEILQFSHVFLYVRTKIHWNIESRKMTMKCWRLLYIYVHIAAEFDFSELSLWKVAFVMWTSSWLVRRACLDQIWKSTSSKLPATEREREKASLSKVSLLCVRAPQCLLR